MGFPFEVEEENRLGNSILWYSTSFTLHAKRGSLCNISLWSNAFISWIKFKIMTHFSKFTTTPLTSQPLEEFHYVELWNNVLGTIFLLSDIWQSQVIHSHQPTHVPYFCMHAAKTISPGLKLLTLLKLLWQHEVNSLVFPKLHYYSRTEAMSCSYNLRF